MFQWNGLAFSGCRKLQSVFHVLIGGGRWVAIILCLMGVVFVGIMRMWPPSYEALTLEEKQRLAMFSLSALLAQYEGRPPPSPSNGVADHPAASVLGQQLFFDPRWSRNSKVSCASCHQPKRSYTDGLSVSRGVGQAHRNAPTLMGSAWLRWFYWDGRKDSLWSQALSPMEAANEMGGNRLGIVRGFLWDDHYRQAYIAIFGDLSDVLSSLLSESSASRPTQWPEAASPLGTTTERQHWRRLTASQRFAINRVFSNIGKAIEAYERRLIPELSRFDRWLDAVAAEQRVDAPLSDTEIAGMRLFMDSEKTGCINCHNGPLFTNHGFHNIGTGNLHTPPLDFGRVLGLQAIHLDPFNCLGRFSDAPPNQCSGLRFASAGHQDAMMGAYKVPSLRGVRHTAPYFHDGRFQGLRDVLDFYRSPPSMLGQELKPLVLEEDEVDALIAFLAIL